MSENQWPKVGSKITFKGTHTFWFTNIVKDAKELLEIGKEYTISKLELASSWCSVTLEEIPDKMFALSFFNYPKELTTDEQYAVEGRLIRKIEDWNFIPQGTLTEEQTNKIRERFKNAFKK